MTTTHANLLSVLPPHYREQLLETTRDASFPAGARMFEEGAPADHFWVVRTGTVTLDMKVPGRRPVTVDTMYPGDLVGWSWLFPPYVWHLGAEAMSPVRALEFDAGRVRDMCEVDAELGRLVGCRVAEIIGHRLQQARTRLLDVYAPHGSGQWS